MRFILLVLLFCGCATSWNNEKVYKIDGRAQIINGGVMFAVLTKAFRTHPIVADAQYAMVEEAWLNEFLLHHRFYVLKNELKYSTSWDCDDWARDFANLAQKYYNGEEGADALAIGQFYYITDEGYWHVINIAVVSGKIIFIEPQTSKIIQLSNREVNNCHYIII